MGWHRACTCTDSRRIAVNQPRSSHYVNSTSLHAQLRTELELAGLTPSRRTYELLTRSYIVRRDIAAMLATLKVRLARTLFLFRCMYCMVAGLRSGCWPVTGLPWLHVRGIE